MKSLILLSLFLQVTLISKTFAKTANLFLTPQQYSRLSKPMQKNYVKKIRFEFMQFEKSFGNQKYLTESNQSIQNYFVQNLLINNAFADESTEQDTDSFCIIGGVQVPVIKNKCSTRNNLCNDENSTIKDSFQCGKVFGSKCVSRLPIKNLSQRCFDEAKDVAISPIEYKTLTDEANNFFDSICSDKPKNKIGCSLLEKKLTELKEAPKNNDTTQAVVTLAQTPDKTNPPSDDKKPNAKNTKDECNQILNLTIEGSDSNHGDSPIRQRSLHSEAANYVAGLADFANTENYWIEPTDKIINNCGKNSKDNSPELITETNKALAADIVSEINKTSEEKTFCTSDVIKKLADVFVNKTSTQNLKQGLIYKNKYSRRLIPTDQFQNCSKLNASQTPFISLSSTKDTELLNVATPFIERIKKLNASCPANNKPTISIGLFANSANFVDSNNKCRIQLLNGKYITAKDFFEKIFKPALQSGFPVTLNSTSDYDSCFTKELEALSSADQNTTGKRFCSVTAISQTNPGHDINEIFGISSSRMYVDFLHNLKNPLKAKLCVSMLTTIPDIKQKDFLDTFFKKNTSLIDNTLYSNCKKVYDDNYSKIKNNFLTSKVKQNVLACLKSNAQTSLFGLSTALNQTQASTEEVWSNYKESDIADCNQDWSVYKKTAPDKEAATKPTASTTKPAAAAEAKQ